MGKVSLLSLGCPKNLVDSGKLLEKLKERGIFYSSKPEESDIMLINTCGFIESAKKESIEEILKLSGIEGERTRNWLCSAAWRRDMVRNSKERSRK